MASSSEFQPYKRGSKIKPDEQLELTRAWVTVTDDPITGTNQSAENFWNKVLDTLIEFSPRSSLRTADSIRVHFSSHIKANCQLWTQSLRKAYGSMASGEGPLDMMNKANLFYKNAHPKKKTFDCFECHALMKHLPLFDYNTVQVAETISLDPEGELGEQGEGSQRPIGRDAARKQMMEKKKKKSSQASSQIEYAASMRSVNEWQERSGRIAEEINGRLTRDETAINDLIEMRRMQMEREELLAQDRINANDDVVMDRDLSNTPVEDHDYWLSRKAEIRRKRGLQPDPRYYG